MASGKVAKLGPEYIIQFIAFISVSIGLINLFPVPLLDGGHLMFYAIEAVRGRPLSEKTQEFGLQNRARIGHSTDAVCNLERSGCSAELVRPRKHRESDPVKHSCHFQSPC